LVFDDNIEICKDIMIDISNKIVKER
jgi:hypothetical protein